MKVTNNSKALQGVHSATGVVFLQPGESKDVDLTEAGHKLASRLDFLKFSGAAPKSAEGESDKEALLAKLKALGIEAGKNSSIDTLQKRLAEAQDKAKVELIAQLKEKGVEVGDDVTLEELQAELAKHQ
ncbi:hypothetical protein [Pseudomonas sp. LS-2]|uniref:hypothetical protein n=1 Tax=Pseudomonas sp. LS-2 TaxID=2315859 RepID=UPI000E75BF8C|nr:hypothetical protein [Pseudomonas sp. LS-2]RJX83489.1 hypothetical protein D3M70_00230 [Pseudomonas sp. LS-2]